MSRTTESFDDLVIRPSPPKPFETADSPLRDPLLPCNFCGRKFTKTNLNRHVTICERLAQKPRRKAFQAVAQRLSHIAQEDAVRPIIREILEKRSEDSSSAQSVPLSIKKEVKGRRRKEPARGGRTGADLFKELQRGHSKCQYCERTFCEEAYERHVVFCKVQYAATQRQKACCKGNPQSSLLMLRVKYRPPMPRSLSKESPLPVRRQVSSALSDQKTSMERANETKSTGSQLAMAKMGGSNPKDQLEITKLADRLREAVVSTSSPKPRLNPPSVSSLDKNSPSDYGSGESLLSRNGSDKPGHGNGTILGNSVNHISSMREFGYGDSGLLRTGSVRVKNTNGTIPAASVVSSKIPTVVRTPLQSDKQLNKNRSISPDDSKAVFPTTIQGIKNSVSDNSLGKSFFHSEGSLKNQGLLDLMHGKSVSSENGSKNGSEASHCRSYPFNVASQQKEHMMQLHRSNSVKAKSSGVSVNVNWDSFLNPSLMNERAMSVKEGSRYFQWDGKKLSAPSERDPARLPDGFLDNSHFNKTTPVRGRFPHQNASPLTELRRNGPYKLPPSHEESIEETDAATSNSTSPISPLESTGSCKSSAIGSMSSFSSGNPQKSPFPHDIETTTLIPSAPKYCHNCGKKFPLADAAFCCHCGMKRLVNVMDL